MVDDVGKAAKDWPQLNFVIYHGGYRHAAGGRAEDGWNEFEQTGRVSWVSDLAEIPEKYGVTNVYADVGQLFAQSVVAEPQLGAALMGIMGKGMGYERSGVGHRRGVDRLAAMADRGAAAARNPRGHAEEVRLQAARRRPTVRSRPRSSAAPTPSSTTIDISKRTDIGPNRDRFARMKEEYEKNGPARSQPALRLRARTGRLVGIRRTRRWISVSAAEAQEPRAPQSRQYVINVLRIVRVPVTTFVRATAVRIDASVDACPASTKRASSCR